MKKILLLQTGGTIAMQLNSNGPELDSDRWSDLLYKEIPELSQVADLEAEKVFFEDSSDVNRSHWKLLAESIYQRYENYDGFVILHGTDTMAYTASALSFALLNSNKPIIFTGSQVPMSKLRSDARRNLVNAVELATQPIPEIAICFNDHLFRGNRSTKMSIGDFDAFASPNYPHLAEIGIDIKLSENILKPTGTLSCNPVFDDSIFVLKLHPNLKSEYLDCLDLGKIKVVIIEAFGSGNMPVKGDYNLLPFLDRCKNQGVHVIITSQAAYDSVTLEQYSSGREAKKRGALSAGSMTMEATITKSMYLLGQNLDQEKFRNQFEKNLAGER
ncbi:asparaginase [Rhodohalobacter barkolensis]|uniref:asparaginase n=1 Tax=Rhodohalobacter barkolensis TaxID=2053187 RepID=A0A2N0VL02_9BACT|nr:asparaginase [Rhodohalobacter barkolensis]PKD44876.1 asparaginase [Rhodohalobacter barkolensis]